MPTTRRRPSMVSSPAELRLFRAEAAGATRSTLATVLGVSTRAVASWEGAEVELPKLLPWALLAAKPHVESLSRYRQRRAVTNRRRREKAKHERLARIKRAAEREVERQVAQARRAEVERQRKKLHSDLRSLEKAAGKYIRQAQRNGPIREAEPAPVSFITPPRPEVIRPRAIRSDLGGTHKWRGRPGLALRPEDLHEES